MKYNVFVPITPVVFALGMLGVASPSASPAPAASAAVSDADAAVTAQAKEWLHRAQTAVIDRAQLDKAMDDLYTPELATQVAAQLGPLGDPAEFKLMDKKAMGDNTTYIFKVSFQKITMNEIFSLDRHGKIAGLRFAPAQ